MPHPQLTKNISIRSIDTLSEEEQAEFSGEARLINHVSLFVRESRNLGQSFHRISYQSAGGEIFTRTLERANHVLYWYVKERFPEPLAKHYDFLLTPDKEFEFALSALRVLKDEAVGLFPQEHFLIKLPLPEGISRSTHRSIDGYQLSNPSDVKPYILLPEEVETLSSLVHVIRQVKQAGILTALSRLDNQYTRAHLVDRLIDAVVGIEALYAGDVMNEITLRVGLRLSAFLGGSDGDLRDSYFNLFKIAYGLRSSLVHGSMHNSAEIGKELVKKGWKDPETFMAEIDKVLRASLRTILLNIKDKSLKERLHEPLDKAIRRGEPFSW